MVFVSVGVLVIVRVFVGVGVMVAVGVNVGKRKEVQVGGKVIVGRGVSVGRGVPAGVCVHVGGRRIGVAVEVGNSIVGGRVGGGKGLKKISGLIKTAVKQAHMLQVNSKTSTVKTSHGETFFIDPLPMRPNCNIPCCPV
jgi:NDP-sugar pyrophosphorylase family protein